ncbi:hypothetical protein pb186bvf_007368 [Paramecium bursaria]
MLEERNKIKQEQKQLQENCNICEQKIKGLLKRSKFCVFCNKFICKSHLVKKRPDPLNLEKLIQICSQCEEAKLEKLVFEKHNKTQQELVEQEHESLLQIEELMAKLDMLKNEQQNIRDEKKQQTEKHLSLVQNIQQQISELDQRLEEQNEEAVQLNEKHRLLLQNKKEEENQKSVYEQQIQEQQKELYEADLTLKNLCETINQLENELKQVIIIDVPIDRKLNRSEEGKGTIMFDSTINNLSRPSNIQKKSHIKDKPVSTKGYWCV